MPSADMGYAAARCGGVSTTGSTIRCAVLYVLTSWLLCAVFGTQMGCGGTSGGEADKTTAPQGHTPLPRAVFLRVCCAISGADMACAVPGRETGEEGGREEGQQIQDRPA
eukprot:3194722-Rhodomonas_salina.4